MSATWNFTLNLALASNSECVLPQSPTEGCGVIPEGRSMCIDPDPGGPYLIAPFLHLNFFLQSH